MSKLIFKPEDFDIWPYKEKPIAERAQSIFDKWLSEQLVVYGRSIEHLWHKDMNCIKDPSHTARLICIEEIAPAKCEHVAETFSKAALVPYAWVAYRCKLCGKELEPATWKEK